jgi:hypothetical protein
MGSFFGGGGNKTTTSQSTTAPWAPMQPYDLGALQSAQDLYNKGPPQIWQGQYMAPQSAQTTGAVGGITDLTQSGILQNLISGAQGTAQNVASGANQGGGNAYLQMLMGGGGAANQYATGQLPGQLGTGNQAQATAQNLLTGLASGQNVVQNPYLNSMYQQASTPLIQQWQNQIQPGINAQFSAAGRYGMHPGGALNATETQAQTGLGQALGNLSANLYGNAYGQNLQQQTAALQGLTGLGTTQTAQQLGYGGLLSGLQGINQQGAAALNQNQLGQGTLQLGAAQAMPGLANAAYAPYQQLGAAGQTMDQYNQANQAYQEQLYNYMNGGGAWSTLQNYTNLLNANPASRATSSTGTQTQQAPTQSLFGQILGGVAGVGSLLGTGGLSGIGAGLMGGLGALGAGGGLGALGAGGGLFNNIFGSFANNPSQAAGFMNAPAGAYGPYQ